MKNLEKTMKNLEKILIHTAVLLLGISVICLWRRVDELQAQNKDMAIVVLADDSALRVLMGIGEEKEKPISHVGESF